MEAPFGSVEKLQMRRGMMVEVTRSTVLCGYGYSWRVLRSGGGAGATDTINPSIS